jgi:N-acetyl-anhydromuramyl-L-alanine amidase AmpD
MFARRSRLLAGGFATLLALAAACSDRAATAPDPTAGDPLASAATRLDTIFARAGAEFDVPGDLVKAISFTETRWQMVRGEVEFDGIPTANGLMALRGTRLAEGARLAGVTEAAARTDTIANVRAAAALLGRWAADAAINRHDVGAVATRGGEVVASIAPTPASPDFNEMSTLAVAPDYPGAVWRPSPNYNARPTGDIGVPHMVIIHTCEGSYSSCWSWLTNSSAQASAHYVVNESGSEISQLVRESDRAWHIAATYDCSLNSSHDCWRNGYSSNHFTIGIEHGGYASQSSFPVGQIDASAKLSCDISRDRNIPRDRYHFVAHGQLQPYNRTDPGPNWPWTDYMNRINSHCGSSSIIIDSNNANNDASVARIEVSSNWISSSASAGYYGSGYYYASTEAISDGATFWFYLPANASKTIDAWWTAGSNRSATAPYIAYNAAGTEVGRVSANQQANGGKWNALGTWNFTAGWNRIVLSRWTTAGYVVIADAVRVR